jgi:2-oxoglutarate ferredoxin oxidoreductase subunit beta
MRLRKLHADYDPTDRIAAMNQVQALAASGEIATGLLYVDAQAGDMHQALNTVAKPLNALREAELCPGADVLEKLNASLR